MSLTAKIQKFFGILSDCFVMRVPDAYEQEKHAVDPYGTCENKRPAGYVIGGQYGG
jgi:hypothetical protein